MNGLIVAVHILICVLLIAIILVQAGRGGGLVGNFTGVESILGTKTNSFLTRTTSILSILFFITCLGLAFMSAQRSRSLMTNVASEPVAVKEDAKGEDTSTSTNIVTTEATAGLDQPLKEAAPEQPKNEIPTQAQGQ